MKKFKSFGAALALLVCSFLLFSTAQAAYYDPKINWQTLDSPHFQIHYPKSLANIAQKAGNYFEAAHTNLSKDMDWSPKAKTQVVLVDNTDDANGFASVLPYNWVVIFAVAPRADSSLGNYDDWLKVVINHEYTHVLHFDRAKGFWKPFRLLLGHTIAPAGVLPVWLKEGFATYQETRLTGTGRGNASYTQMVLRSAVLEDDFPHLDEANGFGWKWPSYRSAYLFGVEFLEYLEQTRGHESLQAFNDRTQRSPMLFAVNRQAKKAFDEKTYYQLWREWKAKLTEQYQAQVASLGELSQLNEVRKTVNDEVVSSLALSPDKKKLAFVVETPHGPAQIRLLDLESQKESVLRKKQGAIALSWLPDGSGILYAAPTRYRRYSIYNDLWKYDFKSKKVKRLTFGERARDPHVSPDGKQVVYVAAVSGYDELRIMPLNDDAMLKQEGSGEEGVSFEPEGTSFSALDKKENPPLDEENLAKPELKKAKKLVQTPRLVLQLADKSLTQFSHPSFSPDGKRIIFTGHNAKESWKLYVLDMTAKALQPALNRFAELNVQKISKRLVYKGMPVKRVTNAAGNELDATWLNEKQVLFSSDRSGINNVYLHNLSTGKSSQVSNVASGVFNPQSDGENVFVQHYHSRGFALMQLPFQVTQSRGLSDKSFMVSSSNHGILREPQDERVPPNDTTPANETFPTKEYSPFGRSLFLPQFLLPGVYYTGDTTIVTAVTGGADPLYRHIWRAGGSYRFDADHFGYFGTYIYNRYRPIFSLNFSDVALNFGTLNFINGVGQIHSVHYFEERRGGSASLSVPFGRNVFSGSYFYEDRFPAVGGLSTAEKNSLNTGIFSGFRLLYSFGDSESYPASITHNEQGRQVTLLGSITDSALGSGQRNEQKIFAGDWREFVRLYRHHVLALRAAGGISSGDRLLQGTFGFGGSLGEGNLAGGGSLFYFPLRGLPVSFLSRTRSMLLSSEYRFPLVSPQRGLGTWPFYLKNIHGALFSDFGDAWNENQKDGDINDFFRDFFLSVGAELRGDFVIGNGLPLTGRLGYGIVVLNRDRLGNLSDETFGTSLKNGVIILQLGTSF